MSRRQCLSRPFGDGSRPDVLVSSCDHSSGLGRWGQSLIGLSVCAFLMSGQAWGGVDREGPKKSGATIVAAGFGYQIGDESTITVKIYDAVSGDILADEVYELNVNEGTGARSNTAERIFAGGVGLGAEDLSNFVLRVYDANTGKFEWEGRLNLAPGDGNATGRMVSTLEPRRAMVTRIHAVDEAMRQPVFILRAWDASTGGLIWEDEFSASGIGIVRSQPIVFRHIEHISPAALSMFDFRIRMFDRSGQNMLWEDRVSQQESDNETHEAVDERASMLPAWPNDLRETSPSEGI